jgi:hypothetical protein
MLPNTLLSFVGLSSPAASHTHPLGNRRLAVACRIDRIPAAVDGASARGRVGRVGEPLAATEYESDVVVKMERDEKKAA